MTPREDEFRFRQEIADRTRRGEEVYAREIATELGMNTKRACYLCEKWIDKGWWECGVNALAGWLTEEGKAAFGLNADLLPNKN